MSGPARRGLALAVASGSALLLLGALGFQYLGGIAPCPLCLYQRLPHALAIPLAVGAAAAGLRPGRAADVLLGLAGLVLAAGAGLALYHVGIERHWWPGPSSCAGTGVGVPGSIADLQAQLGHAKIVRCDAVAWSLLGISLAGFNAIFSTGLAVLAWLPLLRVLAGHTHLGRDDQTHDKQMG